MERNEFEGPLDDAADVLDATRRMKRRRPGADTRPPATTPVLAGILYGLGGLHLLAAPVALVAGLAAGSPSATVWLGAGGGSLLAGFFWLGLGHIITLLHRIWLK